MHVVDQVSLLKDLLLEQKKQSKRIALVPTMGNLHEGHLSLVEIAKKHAEITVVSIFVNPTQFGPNEDFDKYPRTIQRDLALLQSRGVHVVFTPTTEILYPAGFMTHIHVGGISEILCGQSRPTHFSGVATIVAKLFHIVAPDVAIFGQKDFQQFTLLSQMVHDLNMAVEMICAPTIREDDGLAKSSRNQYLNHEDRSKASLIYQSLCNIRERIHQGETNFSALEASTINNLNHQGFAVDYVAIMNRKELQPATINDKEKIALIAAKLGSTRLIDNLFI